MDSIQNILRKTLENLTGAQFKKFKHNLKDIGTIPWGELEKSDSDDTVDLIVQAHTVKDSDGVILRILKMMNLNQLAMDIEKELEEHLQKVNQEEEEEKERQRKGKNKSDAVCSLHKQEFKLICQVDGELVCYECLDSNIHSNHNFKPISTQALAFKEELKITMMDLKKQMLLREEDKLTFDETAKHAKSQIKDTDTKIKMEFEELHKFLRDEEAARRAELRDEGTWIEKMGREISSLSDTIRAIEEQMSADDITFLQNYKSTVERAQCTLQDPERVSGALINVAKHLGNLKCRVLEKMQEIVQYTPVTLDPKTSNPHLILSEDLASVRYSDERQQLPDNPERFDKYGCVLGSEGFNSGTHCWDVEVGENTWWSVGVMAESHPRKGSNWSKSGRWRVRYKDGKYGAGSTLQPLILLTVKQKPQRIRVQLDWDRGKLSFSDPDNNTHLHTVTHTFTERVFPYFNVVCNLSPLRMLPVRASVKVE